MVQQVRVFAGEVQTLTITGVIAVRVLFVIVAIVLLLMLFGWLRYGTPDGRPSIQVDTDKVQQDTNEIANQTERVIERATEAVNGQ